jgi:23S rRNA pseudouridine1911/1915/1917 synthase
VGERRTVPVPDGLDGLRLDAALARIFGFSRTTAATLVDTGGVTVDGRTRDRSDRVTAGAWLEVDMPEPPAPPSAAPEPVPGLTVVYADDDIVVVDKPVGVAAHPTPGWDGPTVTQGVARWATGCRPRARPNGRAWCTGSTSAPPG